MKAADTRRRGPSGAPVPQGDTEEHDVRTGWLSAVQHYASCSCGWRSTCVPTKQAAAVLGRRHKEIR